MKVPKPIVAVPAKYGAVLGVILFAVYFGMQVAGQQPGVNLNTFFIQGLLLILFMYFALREFKEYHNNSTLHYWQGMTGSFFVYTLGAVIYATGLLVWLTIDGDTLQQIITDRLGLMERKKETFIAGGGTEEVYQSQIEQLKQLTPSVMFIDQLIRTLLTGVLVAVLPSIILRKKPPGE